jgi:8-oxo-dGTP pyrophosphatase MutT (NUDIX family)
MDDIGKLCKFSVSVFSIIFNKEGDILLASKDGKSRWTAIGGWMEQETVVECINREIKEELGEIDFQIVDIIDAHVWNYKDNMPIVSILALVKHIGGIPVAKDDIEGFALKWFKPDELGKIDIDCPRQPEIIHKALFLMEEYTKRPEADFLKYKWRLLS